MNVLIGHRCIHPEQKTQKHVCELIKVIYYSETIHFAIFSVVRVTKVKSVKIKVGLCLVVPKTFPN